MKTTYFHNVNTTNVLVDHVKKNETKQRGLIELAGFEVRNKWGQACSFRELELKKKTFNMMEIYVVFKLWKISTR